MGGEGVRGAEQISGDGSIGIDGAPEPKVVRYIGLLLYFGKGAVRRRKYLKFVEEELTIQEVR